MNSTVRGNGNDRLDRQLNRLSTQNPDVSRALQAAAEAYSDLKTYLPNRIADLLKSAAASVHLNPVLYLWVFEGFFAALCSYAECSLRGNEISHLSLQISIAANIGAGKSTSSKYIMKHFLDSLRAIGLPSPSS